MSHCFVAITILRIVLQGKILRTLQRKRKISRNKKENNKREKNFLKVNVLESRDATFKSPGPGQ